MTDYAIRVRPVRALRDNYIWLIHDGRHAAVVDPGVAAPVRDALKELRLELTAILLTHLHYDHNLGVPELVEQWQVPVFGPSLNAHDRVSHPPFPREGTVPLDCATEIVGEGNWLVVPALGVKLSVIAVPGHTRGHIAFFDEQRHWLFCGDTLFAGGCGKVFGGSYEAMVDSLKRLAALPADTEVYCAHEYTLTNLRFALAAEPTNAALQQRYEVDLMKRQLDLPTVPSTIALELATNPFLRLDQPQILQSLRDTAGGEPATPSARFEVLRAWKDQF